MSRRSRDADRLLAENLREASCLRLARDYGGPDILRGRVKRAVLTADAVLVGEFNRPRRAPLRVRDVRLDIDGLLFNPQRLAGEDKLEILDIQQLRISQLTVTEQDLDLFIRGQPVAAVGHHPGEGTGEMLVTGPRSGHASASAPPTRPALPLVENVSIGGCACRLSRD